MALFHSLLKRLLQKLDFSLFRDYFRFMSKFQLVNPFCSAKVFKERYFTFKPVAKASKPAAPIDNSLANLLELSASMGDLTAKAEKYTLNKQQPAAKQNHTSETPKGVSIK